MLLSINDLHSKRDTHILILYIHLVSIKVNDVGMILCVVVMLSGVFSAITNRSRTVGSIKGRWFREDSSTPFGYADRVMVVSCSLIGVFGRASPGKMESRMMLRCSRRESPKYFLELTREKLCPRPRELRSDDRRCRLRILFLEQHSKYLRNFQIVLIKSVEINIDRSDVVQFLKFYSRSNLLKLYIF